MKPWKPWNSPFQVNQNIQSRNVMVEAIPYPYLPRRYRALIYENDRPVRWLDIHQHTSHANAIECGWREVRKRVRLVMIIETLVQEDEWLR